MLFSYNIYCVFLGVSSYDVIVIIMCVVFDIV